MKLFINNPNEFNAIYFCIDNSSGTRIDEYGKFNKWLPRSHKGNLWL